MLPDLMSTGTIFGGQLLSAAVGSLKYLRTTSTINSILHAWLHCNDLTIDRFRLLPRCLR